MRAYFSRLLWWRVGVVWYVVALLSPVIGFGLVAYMKVLLGRHPHTGSARGLDAGW